MIIYAKGMTYHDCRRVERLEAKKVIIIRSKQKREVFFFFTERERERYSDEFPRTSLFIPSPWCVNRITWTGVKRSYDPRLLEGWGSRGTMVRGIIWFMGHGAH